MSFNCFNFEDLKSFRLVCSLWYTLSLDKWRRSVTVNLSESKSSKNGVSIRALCRLNNTQLFQLQKKPYRKYKIKGWSSDYPNSKNHAWSKIITACVESLRIESCYFSDSNRIEDLILSCGENLKELVLDQNSYGVCRAHWSDEVKNEMPILTGLKKLMVKGTMPLQWSKLLVHTPNLEVTLRNLNNSKNYVEFIITNIFLIFLEFNI